MPTELADPLGIESRPDPLGVERNSSAPKIDPLGIDSKAPHSDPLGIETSAPKVDPLGIEPRQSAPQSPITPPSTVLPQTSPASLPPTMRQSAGLDASTIAATNNAGIHPLQGNEPDPLEVQRETAKKNAIDFTSQHLGRDLTSDEIGMISHRIDQASQTTPRQFEESQAQQSVAGQNMPGRSFLQGVKGALAAPIAAFSPDSAELIQHEQNVQNPVAPTVINKAAGAIGGMVPGVSALATGGGAGIAALAGHAGVSGAGQARTEAAQSREAGNEVSGWQEALAATGYGTVDAATAALVGKIFHDDGLSPSGLLDRGAKSIASNTAIGAGGQIAHNAIAQQTIDPNRSLGQGVPEAAEAGALQGTVLAGVDEVGRRISEQPQPTPDADIKPAEVENPPANSTPPTPTEANSKAEPIPPDIKPAGAQHDTDFVGAFSTMKNAATDGFVDSMWKRVQDGTPIERMGPLENKLRDAQKTGQITSRGDVANIVQQHVNPPQSPAPEDAPNEPWQMSRAEFAKNQGKPESDRYAQQQRDAIVKQAMRADKDIPPEVRADYPESPADALKSKIAKGKPTTAYHYSDKEVADFDRDGVYLTSSAGGYNRRAKSSIKNERQIPSDLKLANKKQATAAGLYRGDKDQYIKNLKAAGFDGAKYAEDGETTHFIIDPKKLIDPKNSAVAEKSTSPLTGNVAERASGEGEKTPEAAAEGKQQSQDAGDRARITSGKYAGQEGNIVRTSKDGDASIEFTDDRGDKRQIIARKGGYESIEKPGEAKGVEGGTGELAKAVGFDQAEGDTKQGDIFGGLKDQLTAAAQHTADSAKRMAGNLFPSITRRARTSGEAMSRWIAARAYAKEAAPVAARQILGEEGANDPKMDTLVGTLLAQDNLDSIRNGFVKQSREAETPEDRKEALDNAARVKDIVGAEGSPIKTQTQYEKLLKDPKVQAIVDRYKQWFSNEPDRNFRIAQGIAPDEEMPSRGEATGARVNLKAVLPDDPKSKTTVYTARRGNLNNPLTKKSPFARQAFGSGQAYDVSLSSMIGNTLAKGTEVARQHEAYDQLVKDGVAVYGKPGTSPEIDGKPTIPFDIKKKTVVTPDGKTVPLNKQIYVRSDVASEFRKALAVDAPVRSAMITRISALANKTALASSIEATYHLRNQLVTAIKSPGIGLVVPDLVANSWKLAKGDPETQSRLMEIARIGALREKSEPLTGANKFNPLAIGSKVVEASDRVGRLMMDKAFTKLAQKGIYKDTETNRRDFINQLGQYNIRGQHTLVALSRDLGTGPFVTAGTNFYAMGAKSLALDPGAKATSFGAAVNLRARVLARYASIAGAVAITNYLQTGRVDGGKNIPFGSIVLGHKKDGSVRYFDALGTLTPLLRGARELGLKAAANYARGKTTAKEAIGDGVRDVAGSAVQPFAGPLVNDLAIGFTGYSPTGYKEADTAKEMGSTPQIAENLKAAAKNANPLIGQLTSKSDTSSRGPLGPFGFGAAKPDPFAEERLAEKKAHEAGKPFHHTFEYNAAQADKRKAAK